MTKQAYKCSIIVYTTLVGLLFQKEGNSMEKEKNSRITESEWQIMEPVWAHMSASSAGITQPQLMELLENKWNKNTVHTFLKRLCDKGYLQVVKETSPHRYIPLISRAECEKEERRSFLNRIYQGSASRMVASFVREGGLTKNEVIELRKLLEKIEEENG